MRRFNYWTPLQALDDENSQNTDTQVQKENVKKDYISPIKVLSHNSETFHKMFKNKGITKYSIKKISIGIKILCETTATFSVIVLILKEHNIQFFTHESKQEKPFKFVLFGLDGKSAEEVKEKMLSLKYKCLDVKKVEKKYDEYTDTLYIVYFENGSVKIHDLKQNVKTLFHMVIKWEYQRKLKNKPVQCFNCQMYGHGEKGCSIKTKCAFCSGRHKTNVCPNKEKVKCANCHEPHAATDTSCKLRESFLLLRENIQRKNSRHVNRNNQNKNSNNATTNNNYTLEYRDFPNLPNSNRQHDNTRFAWPSTQNKNFTRNTQNSNDLFTAEEITQLVLDILNKLKPCKSKEEQFHVVTQLATKYLYNK